MQQFTVPQFIDVEDKVIGPITVRQFVIILTSAGFIALLYKLMYFTSFLITAVVIMGLTAVLAFAKVNGVHFHIFFTNFLVTLFKSNTRVWNNSFGKENLRIETERVVPHHKEQTFQEKNYTASRLAELSLVVDTQGVFRGNEPSINQSSYTKILHTRE